MATYILRSKKGKATKIRGNLVETYNSQTGQRFLVGQQLIKTIRWEDSVEKIYETVRIEITGLHYVKVD